MGLLSFLDFGGDALKESLRQGAVIIDVRTPHEYDQGKIRGSLNIPVEQIVKNAEYIKRMRKPVILCGSGSESSTARRILQQYGVKNVFNGGSWERVLRLVNSL
jgi:phage shock protein E